MTTPSVPPIALAGEPDVKNLIDGLKSEQSYLAADRDRCDPEDELPRWDRLQRVIDHLAAPTPSASSVPVAWVPDYIMAEVLAGRNINVHMSKVETVDHDYPLFAAPQANPAPSALTDKQNPVVLTIEELNALTKERFGNMHSMYGEGFRRLMRSAIEANAEKTRALLQANGATK